MNNQSFVVPQLYDSHVHWQATGEVALGLQLQNLISLEDLHKIEIKKEFLKGDWLVGFGWDENNFQNELILHRNTLDQIFGERPVLFSRTDGHSSWLNSAALKKLGWMNVDGMLIDQDLKKFLVTDSQGRLTGLVHESAHIKALIQLPAYSDDQIIQFLLKAQEIFLSQGITHIRDMTSNRKNWELSGLLEKNNQLKLHVEFNFSCENLRDFTRAFAELKSASQSPTKRRKARGIKFFFDGSLGSQTALLKESKTNIIVGEQLWDLNEARHIIAETWKSGFEVSVHTLGDEAVHQIVLLAREVSASRISGILNLEHVEVLRAETIPLMKPLHIRCHMQPCHWWSDKKWLKTRYAEKMSEIFPWERLRANQIPIYFGSDSPIESPSLFRNLDALFDASKSGIKTLQTKNPWTYQSYPYSDGIKTESHFTNGEFIKIQWAEDDAFIKN